MHLTLLAVKEAATAQFKTKPSFPPDNYFG
jgi:hypothetical protein